MGKVGVSIAHKGDMHTLLDGIPLDEMNTSMTINATAAWLLALYMTVAEENGVDAGVLQGTTQNDIIKEFLSRGTYAFPPEPSMRLIADMIAFTVDEVPKWNPINICSLPPPGGRGDAGAGDRLRAVHRASPCSTECAHAGDRGDLPARVRPDLVLRQRRHPLHRGARQAARDGPALGGARPRALRRRGRRSCLRFRYGVQVNSLGLTEAQPENNVIRIVLEALAVTMGRDARARALQLPAWNEALGLPRPWDQQWSLRIQQILAYETDLLEYPDIFEGSHVMDGLVDELVEGARAEMAMVEEHGGAVEAVPYMKTQLVESHRARVRRIEAGELKVVGPEHLHRAPSPRRSRRARTAASCAWTRPWSRAAIDAVRAVARRSATRPPWTRALEELRAAAARRVREHHARHARRGRARAPPPASGPAALREVFGEYRAPTGVADAAAAVGRRRRSTELRERVERVSEALGRRIKILVGKPGLDGHSNGAEQIAVRARDAGMDVVYEGIRLTPARIARTAVDEGVHVVGLSILSGSHAELIPDVLRRAARRPAPTCRWWSAGSSRRPTRRRCSTPGVARVYTPKDFEVSRIMGDIVDLVAERHGVAAAAGSRRSDPGAELAAGFARATARPRRRRST